MTCPVFNLVDFKATYVEVGECFSDTQLVSASTMALAVYRGFGCLPSDSLRQLALNLATAHYATMMNDASRQGGAIKSLKTRNDSITYARTDCDDPYSLSATFYGSQLAQIMKLCVSTGFTSAGSYFVNEGAWDGWWEC